MGSQRRILTELEDIGIPEPAREDAMLALEKLNSAGDALSDATWAWQNGEGTHAEMLTAARAVLADLTAAVDVLATLPATAAPAPSEALAGEQGRTDQ